MNKIYDVTLASPSAECNITLYSRAEVEDLQDFLWDNTDCESSVRPRKQQGTQGMFEGMGEVVKKAFDKTLGYSDTGLTEDKETEYHFGIPKEEVTAEEVRALIEIDKHIESALNKAHKQLLQCALRHIRNGEEIHSIDLKAGLSIVEEDEDDEK